MSWLYSQALVEEYSADTFLDGAPCALWNGTHTQQASWLPAKMTDACRLSRSGMTFKPLTDDHGEAVLTSFLEAFPARTYQPQEREPALTESEAECGHTWRELSVKFDPDSSSWKTAQCLWDEDLPESSVTLPRWGMMRHGELWERTMPEHLTSGTESGSWPTPIHSEARQGYQNRNNGKKGSQKSLTTVVIERMWQTPVADDAVDRTKGKVNSRGEPKLSAQVKLWPTPTVCGNYNKAGLTAKSGDGLATAVKQWPTPQAHDSHKGQAKRVGRYGTKHGGRNLNDEAVAAEGLTGGSLNPTWVEKLMGWPAQWTNLNPIIDLEHISWIMGFCECEEIRAKEVLRMLRKTDQAKAFQQKTGRPINLQEAQVLLSIMCEHQVSSDQAWILMESEEAPKKQVRVMRVGSKTSSASHRSDHKQQPPREHSDALQTLPRFLAHHGQEAWEKGSWEDAIPRVTHHKASRVDRLKAIGNGQVPAVVRLAWEILTDTKPTNQ